MLRKYFFVKHQIYLFQEIPLLKVISILFKSHIWTHCILSPGEMKEGLYLHESATIKFLWKLNIYDFFASAVTSYSNL